MPWDDARLLVVPGSVASQLQDLSGQVLHDCRHVHWSTSSDPLGIVAFPTETMQLVNVEDETCGRQGKDKDLSSLWILPTGN